MEGFNTKKFKFLKQEFQLQKFFLNNERPKCLVSPQFWFQIPYLTWISIWATYHVIITALQVRAAIDKHVPWADTIEAQGYILMTTFSVSDCISSCYVFFRRSDIFHEQTLVTPWYLKFVWFFYNSSNTFSIYATLAFYIFKGGDFDENEIILCIMNLVFTMLNLIVCAKPTQILHAYQSMIFTLLYCLFTLIYQVLGGSELYPMGMAPHPVLEWTELEPAVIFTVVSVLVVSPVIHLFIFVIYKCRVHLSNLCRKTSVDQSDLTVLPMN